MTENEELHQEETALWTFPFRPPDRGTTIQELTRQTGGKGPETTQRNSCVNQTGRVAHTHTHTPQRPHNLSQIQFDRIHILMAEQGRNKDGLKAQHFVVKP